MKTFPLHLLCNVLAAVVVVILLMVTYVANPSLFKVFNAQAISSANLSGYAWSENIGWISFNSLNCDQDKNTYVDTSCGGTNTSATPVFDYGINLNTTNKSTGGTDYFSGKAWSENVGWVSFDSGETATCGATPAQVNWLTGKITGWAKALSGNANWDGCISLSGASPSYGVVFSGNAFSGYAWGSDAIGWIDFAPTVSGSKLYGVQLAVPPCTASDVPATSWGICQPTTSCTTQPAGTYTVSGVMTGACSAGGTVTVICNNATLVCPSSGSGSGSGSGSTATSTRFYQF